MVVSPSPNQTSPHIPFTVSAVFHEKPGNDEKIHPDLDVIESSWPADYSDSCQKISKSSSIAELTRYIVEELCCSNPLFLFSIMTKKLGATCVDEKLLDVVFVYDAFGHGGDQECLMKTQVMLRNKYAGIKSEKREDDEKQFVYFWLADENYLADQPLPFRDNGYNTLLCHLRYKEMKQLASRSNGSKLLDGEVKLNLLLRINTRSDYGPSRRMPSFVRQTSPPLKMRGIQFTYVRGKNKSGSWSRKDFDPEEVTFDTSSVQSDISYHPIPFTVNLMPPSGFENQHVCNWAAWMKVKSEWSGDPELPSSKSTISEFTRHIVEDLFCQHPSFVSAVISANFGDETQQSMKLHQFRPVSSVIFTYGTVGKGTSRECLKTNVTYIVQRSNLSRNRPSNEVQTAEDSPISLGCTLFDADLNNNIPLPPQSNAYDILSCHGRAKSIKQVEEKNNSTSNEQVNLLLRIDPVTALYKTPPAFRQRKRKAQSEEDDPERFMEISYTQNYKRPSRSGAKTGARQRGNKRETAQHQNNIKSLKKVSSIEKTPEVANLNSPSKYAGLENSEQKADAANLLLSLR